MRGRNETHKTIEGRAIITDLYNNHRRMAYRIIKDVLGKQIAPEEEDDLVQEGFCRMLNRLDSLSGRSQKEYFRYMCSTMLHVAIDEGRKRRGHHLVSFTDILECEELIGLPIYCVDLEERVLSETEHNEMTEILYQALAQLGQQEYDLIVGYYFFEINDRKMGDWLGLRDAVVRVYRRRAIKKLSKTFREIVKQKQKIKAGVDS